MREYLKRLKRGLLVMSGSVLITSCKKDTLNINPEQIIVPQIEYEQENDENHEEIVTSKQKIEKKTLTISAVGDCTLGTDTNFGSGNFNDVFEEVNGNYSYFFKGVEEFLKEDDLSIANLEGTVISEENYEAIEGCRVDKTFNFKGASNYTNILTEGSIEAVNLANNHTFDYGQKGYEETIANLENASIPYFGYDQYYIYETKGIRIGLAGILGWNEEVAKENTEKAINYFHEQNADLIIISYHWGIEREDKQNKTQENIARHAIDCGADLILGTHPHVPQGIECYKGKYIVYSLANFVFGGNRNPEDKDTFIFQQVFHYENDVLVDTYINIIPCSVSSVQNKNDYQPTLLEGEEYRRVRDRVLNSSTNLYYNEGE